MKRRQGYIIALFLLLSLFVNAQGSIKEPPLPKPNDGPGPVGQLPIDGGVTLLLIIGTAFGVYKLKKRNKQF